MATNKEILEQLALCKGINTDINCLLEEVIEGEPTPDQIANMLLGVMQLSEVRFAKLERLLSNGPNIL
jgi:hypothetical protein